jgi:hypothetical protein
MNNNIFLCDAEKHEDTSIIPHARTRAWDHDMLFLSSNWSKDIQRYMSYMISLIGSSKYHIYMLNLFMHAYIYVLLFSSLLSDEFIKITCRYLRQFHIHFFCLVPGQIFMRLSHYSTYGSPHNRIEHHRIPMRQRRHICSNIWRLTYTWLGIDKAKVILFINTLSVYIRRGDEVVMTGIRQYKSNHIIHRDEQHSTRRYDDHCAQLNRRFSTDSFYRCN